MGDKGAWQFQFSWQGIAFQCSVDHQAEQPRLRIAGDLCALPFTAENPEIRSKLLTLAGETSPSDHTGFRISPHHRFEFFSERPLDSGEITKADALREATIEVLKAKPWFKLFLQVMMAPAEETGPAEAIA